MDERARARVPPLYRRCRIIDEMVRERRESVALYFALVFIAAWAWWLLAGAITPADPMSQGARQLLFLPGTFAPGIVAIIITARARGRAGVGELLARLFIWRVDIRFYVFALAYMAGIKLAAAVAHRAVTGDWPAFGAEPVYFLFIAAVFSAPFQAGEEIGWRGYALPRLASSMGLGRASVLLGLIWALWHLPLFYIAGTPNAGQSLPLYTLGVTALSVAMAWLYTRTGGSVLLVMLMHAAVNNTTGIVPSGSVTTANPWEWAASLTGWLTTGLLWIGAIYFLVRMSREGSQRQSGLGTGTALSA